jgi:hypothetical protein
MAAGTDQKRRPAPADHDDGGGQDDYQLFHDRPSLAETQTARGSPSPGGRSGVLRLPQPLAGQALSGSRSRWLTTEDTPSPRMLIP